MPFPFSSPPLLPPLSPLTPSGGLGGLPYHPPTGGWTRVGGGRERRVGVIGGGVGVTLRGKICKILISLDLLGLGARGVGGR